MTHKTKARLEWVKLYAETKNAGLVCRRCGISRPTLRKWWRRSQMVGEAGLEDLSRRPKSSSNRKIFEKEIKLVSELRKRRLGSRRIQSELLRNYVFRVSRATLCKILRRLNVPPLKKSQILRKHRHRYERPIPGERIQIDTCKIAPGLYQYTAIDERHQNPLFGIIRPAYRRQLFTFSGTNNRGNAISYPADSNGSWT